MTDDKFLQLLDLVEEYSILRASLHEQLQSGFINFARERKARVSPFSQAFLNVDCEPNVSL